MDQADPLAETEAQPMRWLVLFGVWLIYFSFGLTLASLGPLVEPIARDLEISYTMMGGILGAWQLIYIAAALPIGAVLDRIGVGTGLVLAAALMGLSGLLRGVSTDAMMLFGAVAIFGIGGPMISIGAPKMIALWFHGRERPTAMGIYITGPSLGGICAFTLTNSVLMPAAGGDWRTVLIGYAVFVLLAGAVWWLIARLPAVRAMDGRAGSASKAASLQAFREIVGLPQVQLVLVMSIGIFLFNHGLNNWLPEMLRTRGLSPAAAGYWAAIPTVVGVVGALTIPRLATPERRIALMIWLILAAGLSTLLLHLMPGPGLALGLALQGIARSSMMTVAILLLMEAPGVPPERAGMAGGMFFTVAEVGGVLGPLGIGTIYDITGGFSAALLALSAIIVGLLLLTLRLRQLSQDLAHPAN